MTENNIRGEAVAALAAKYIGVSESDKGHRVFVDRYNSFLAKNTVKIAGYPRAIKMDIAYPWCACFVSSVAIEAGCAMTLIPVEMSCSKMIAMLRELGSFRTVGAYTPKPGDLIFFDWHATAAKAADPACPDHVGIVERVADGRITTIEGNRNDAVTRCSYAADYRCICGYGAPDYAEEASAESGTAAAAQTADATAVNESGTLSGVEKAAVNETDTLSDVEKAAGTEKSASDGKASAESEKAAVNESDTQTGTEKSADTEKSASDGSKSTKSESTSENEKGTVQSDAAAAGSDFPPLLKRGDHREAVRALQALLNLRSGAGLALDAAFGPLTEAAVNRFRSAMAEKQLTTDAAGTCGSAMWRALIEG